MELLETLPNGREIYSRPKQNIKLEKQAAVELHKTWKKSKNKYKPLFQDKNGQLWEIESGGNTFKTAANPEGYRFGNWVKHFKRGVLRRGLEKEATPNLNEVAAAIKSRFPGLSKTDNVNFAKALITLNDQEITKILASRKSGEHTDHMVALSKGGLNWYKNFINLDAETNLKKSGTLLSTKQIKDLALTLDRQETILSGLSTNLEDNPKFNKKAIYLKNIFNPDTPTGKKLEGYSKGKNIRNASLGGTALTVFELLTPGDASAEQFRSAIHEGGSWSEAFQTFGSEKRGEFTATAKAAPFVLGASKLPFIGAAMSYAAPVSALAALVHGIDKADDIFLEGKAKKYLKEHDPGEKIYTGSQLTSMPGDFDFKGNKSINYNSNVIQDKQTGEWHSYQIPQI